MIRAECGKVSFGYLLLLPPGNARPAAASVDGVRPADARDAGSGRRRRTPTTRQQRDPCRQPSETVGVRFDRKQLVLPLVIPSGDVPDRTRLFERGVDHPEDTTLLRAAVPDESEITEEMDLRDSARAEHLDGVQRHVQVRVDLADQADAVWGDVRQGSSSIPTADMRQATLIRAGRSEMATPSEQRKRAAKHR